LGVDFVRRRSTNVITQPIPAFIGLAALLADLAHCGIERGNPGVAAEGAKNADLLPKVNATSLSMKSGSPERRSYVRSEAIEDFRSSTLTLGLLTDREISSANRLETRLDAIAGSCRADAGQTEQVGHSQGIHTNNARSLPRSRRHCGARLRAILS
jgi:hypothetical protein